MGHDIEGKTSLLPYNLEQNPAPTTGTGQEFQRQRQALVNDIMRTFLAVLPSNYVSLVNGPWYTLQFQAIAEQLAAIQLAVQEVYKDSDFDFTRTEFLWDVLGILVFPGASAREGAPTVDGDVEYRAFLHRMVLLLLRGATASVIEEGAELLTDSNMTLVEKFLHSVQRDPIGAWTIDNQFEMELNVEGFPTNPFLLQENIPIILLALKPAHTLFEYRHLFRETFGTLFTDEPVWELDTYYYDDLRKYCYGAKEITGSGDTLADRTLFSDPGLSFGSVRGGAGSLLVISSGVNEGQYPVVDVRAFPYGDDSTARAYTTSPTSLTGTATVSGDVITDTTQNWALAEEGEVLTFTAGPNVGSYRLETLLGSGGGLLGSPTAVGPATQVRVSPSILRVDQRMPQASVTGQAYTVTVDRLGVRGPRVLLNEDASEQFYL